ncbi:olfactory receptor 5D18 [Hydra vulgaris]|uniref:olfactory receptor 5D18 n=1 Tax=Hydra vulgaris TaxID=6087 RepID=UPI0032EA0046
MNYTELLNRLRLLSLNFTLYNNSITKDGDPISFNINDKTGIENSNNKFIVYGIFSFIGVILNIVGLIVLVKFTKKLDLTQRYILIQLCFIDFCLSLEQAILCLLTIIDKITYKILGRFFIALSILKTALYYTTFWFTFDRFLHIKLNVKYIIYWSKKKTIIVMVILLSIAILIGSLVGSGVINFAYEYTIYACYDLVIVSFSVFFYTYTLVHFYKQKANLRSNQLNKGVFKGILLSVSIITIFVVLFAIPDALMALLNSEKLILNDPTYMYVSISLTLSLWTDALVYIFASPEVRIILKRKLIRLIFKKEHLNKSKFTATISTSIGSIKN